MPKIYVKTAFKLQHRDQLHEFDVGNHTVSAEIAEHWYVKAHTGDEPVADPDASAAADELLAELDAKARALQAAADAIAEREKAAEARDADLTARATALDARETAIAEREKAAESAAKPIAKPK